MNMQYKPIDTIGLAHQNKRDGWVLVDLPMDWVNGLIGGFYNTNILVAQF
jgi:hypothetical protein